MCLECLECGASLEIHDTTFSTMIQKDVIKGNTQEISTTVKIVTFIG